MDRAFMEHYYDSVYEDIIGVLTLENEDYQAAKAAFTTSQNALLAQCGGMNNQIWQQHETVMSAYYRTQSILVKLAYLKGAEDREKMLR